MADPKIKYDIEANVNGSTSVEDLERHLRQLGGVLEGDLSQQANAAADALKGLGEKQAAVETLRTLSNESSAVAVELQQAQRQVDQLGAQMAEAATRAQAFTRAELQAKTALEGKSADLERARTALRQMQAETTGAARSTDEYRQGTAALRGDIQRLVAEVGLERAALKNSEAQARTAQQAQNALSGQYDASAAALMRVRGAQQDNNAALDAARERLRATGIDTSNLSQAERNLATAMEAVRQEALQIIPAYAKVVQSTQQVAAETTRTGKTMRDGMTSISTQLQNIQSIATAALGGGFATGLLKDVTDTADAFNNLSARVKLATGEGANFETGFKGVQQVALQTSSALESTGTLFARIVSAGKEFNLTQDAALGLTRTINQAVQLSGASASASDAAITQLIQGLQSGVLRGEEFNSVMEQAPRLAQALAAGLGVTTGQLRAMAQAGELTAKTVITSLQSQSAALQDEFTKLPATVGRAITNLQTQWSLFVGNLDSSTGVTSYVANGINLIANNLETVVRVATLAGGALMASLGVQAVAALRAYAAQAAVAAGATNLLSASIANVPKTVNIVVAVTGFELGYQLGEMLRENSTMARQLGVVMVGYFEVVVNSLRLAKEAAAAVFTSDTIDAAYDRYMQRNQQVREILQVMMVDAEQAPTKVADAATQASTQLQGVGTAATAAGQQVAAAGAVGAAGVGRIGKAAADTLSIFQGLLAEAQKPLPKSGAVLDIAMQLNEARLKGLDLNALLIQELPDALEKLSGPELAKFRQEFVLAMQVSGGSTKEVQTGLRLIGEQAAKSLGIDLVAAGGQVSKAFKESDEAVRLLILSMPALKAAGVDAGEVVGQALSKMLDGAKSQAEVDAVRVRIEALRKDLGEPLANGLLDQAKQKTQELNEALDKAKPGINSLAEAMKQLGITSDASLKDTAAQARVSYDAIAQSGKASAREMADAFKVAADAAIKANGGIAPSWVTAQASARGYKIEVDDAGRTTLEAMKRAQDSLGGVEGAHRSAAGAARDQANAVQSLASAYTDAGAKAMAAQGQILEAAQRQKNADTSASSITNRKSSETMFVWTRSSIIDYLKQAGLEDAVAEQLSKQFLNGKGEVDYIANDAQKRWAGKYGTLTEALGKVAEFYKYDEGGQIEALDIVDRAKRDKELRDQQRNPKAPAPAPAPTTPGGNGGSGGDRVDRVVNVYIGNSTPYSVPTNDGGQRNIEAIAREVLRLLELQRNQLGY